MRRGGRQLSDLALPGGRETGPGTGERGRWDRESAGGESSEGSRAQGEGDGDSEGSMGVGDGSLWDPLLHRRGGNRCPVAVRDIQYLGGMRRERERKGVNTGASGHTTRCRKRGSRGSRGSGEVSSQLFTGRKVDRRHFFTCSSDFSDTNTSSSSRFRPSTLRRSLGSKSVERYGL